MRIEQQGTFGRWAPRLGLLAVAALGAGLRPSPAAAMEKEAASIVADWPDSSREAALAMIEMHGQPQEEDAKTLTWYGLYRGRRTVVHRGSEGEGAIEQVVLYRVPDEKTADLTRFDDRLVVDKDAAELSVRTNSESTNFLILNLADEIASGFKTVDQAKEFYKTQMQLAESGKSSSYFDRLRFEEPLPVALPPTTDELRH